jgi:5-methylcytosine-specific restriction endonuclease McrA
MDEKEKKKQYQLKYKSKPGIKEYYAKKNREWIAKNRDKYNQAKSKYRFKVKLEVLMHYSKGSLSCAICGYNEDIDALCLDHINDDGAAHRKELGCSSRNDKGGTTIYERFKAKGPFEGLQVLCFNCNAIKELRRKRKGITSAEYLEIVKNGFSWK